MSSRSLAGWAGHHALLQCPALVAAVVAILEAASRICDSSGSGSTGNGIASHHKEVTDEGSDDNGAPGDGHNNDNSIDSSGSSDADSLGASSADSSDSSNGGESSNGKVEASGWLALANQALDTAADLAISAAGRKVSSCNSKACLLCT